ncbi:hypothetical protein CJ214_05450 [Peptoniphilus lacrimalis]|nr:hypothetical protein CJ214_05450 [Peptoniphilus lacrimalis]
MTCAAFVSINNKTRQIARALQRAHVFAAQKQCFCLELLSESKCIRALRSKRSCKSIRAKIIETKRFMGGGVSVLSDRMQRLSITSWEFQWIKQKTLLARLIRAASKLSIKALKIKALVA